MCLVVGVACSVEKGVDGAASKTTEAAATLSLTTANRPAPTIESKSASGTVRALAAPSPGSPARFVIVGGGPVPESNEVSVEQDVGMVRNALRGPGVVLFAGGGDASTVRELSSGEAKDSVKAALGELFAPRPGRSSRYRAPRFPAERATFENVERTLTEALSHGGDPLLLYIAGHGDKGETAEKNSVALWGRRPLNVTQLAAWHERYQRPLRLVATTCFSGGFGELAFAGADAKQRKPSPVPRCGVFAGTHDRETSGCDPNPSRRAQESYALHLVHAFSGLDKNGSPLAVAEIDFDGDGKIGLLDAHTWARIEAVSFDLPTTTSERWLRAVEPGNAPLARKLAPEDSAVVDRLGAALRLPTEALAQAKWEELDEQIAALEHELDEVDQTLILAEDSLMTELLERWPVIDDPFHPEFEATLNEGRQSIGELLLTSTFAARRQEAKARAERVYERFDRLVVLEARVLRLLRAYETLHKVAALERKGGEAARTYEQLLACERAPIE